MADKVTSLYNALKADGLFKQARSLNDFKAKMAYQGYRSQIYKLARDKGANVGTFSQFTNALGYSSGSPKPKQSYGGYQPQQQNPEENTAMTTAQRAMQVPYRQNTQLGKAPKSAPKNASPFVQSLYEIDDAQKGADYPVDYTSPKATQQVYQRNQQVRRQAAKTASVHIANDEYRRQSQPMIDNGTVGVMKPMGEIEQEMSDSASKFVDANLGDYINKAVLGEQNAAAQRGLDAANRVPLQAGAGGGMGLMVKGMAYNKEVDPDAMAKNLTDNARNGFLKLFQNPSFVAKLDNEAARLGVTPEAYIESIMPHLKDRLAATLQQSEYQKALPKNMLDNVANRFIDSNLTGQLLRLATQTRGQRVMQERASAATAAGENPYYKGSTAENVTADIAGFAADPLFGASAKLGGFVAGKLIGNSTKLAALMANGNLTQRLMARGAQAVTSGGVTGFVFDSTGSVIQNYSTGEDTSLGNTLKVAAKGGTTGAVNFATMSLAGIPLSEIGKSVGLKAIKGGSFWGNAGRATAKVGLESGKTYMEAMGMYLGGYVSGKLEGRTDANGKPIEFDLWNGTMESLPTAIGFRLQHAIGGLKGGRKNEKGEDMGWFGSTLANFKDFVTSDKAKESRFLMTEDERNQIFSSGAMNGLMPDGENIVSYAKRTKNKKVSYDDPYLETDASMIKNTYDQIMADPKVSWDAKAKFSAMVTGIMPSARPMMDYITYSSEDYVKDGLLRGKRKYVNEYSAKGELLSKIPYDSKTDRDNVVYKHNIVRENQRLYNAMDLLARQDRNNYELQNDFFVENMKKPGADVNNLVTNMGNEGSDVFRDFSLFALNSEKGTVLNTIDSVAVRNGMKSEDLIKAMKKNPMKRTDFEQNVCVELRRALEAKAFPDGKVHEEQSNLDGKDVATDNNLGTEQPNGEAVKAELNGLKQAEEEMDVLIRDNDVFGQNFQRLKQQGLTNPQIYDWMVQQGGLTVEQLEPFAHYINANARVQGMQEATKNAIDQHVSSYVQDWTFHGTLNGQEAKGEQAIFVQDRDGRTLILGSGEIAFEHSTSGRAKEGVGDMIVCLDPNTHDVVYLKSDEVTLSQTQDAENFGNEYRQKLQMINSQPYNEAAQKQAMIDAAKPQQEEKVPQDNTTKSEVNTTSGKDNTTSEDLVPQEQPQQVRKFADGSDVPMATDSKGRPTPDYGKMTPEQSAEILTEDFGENAEKVVDGQIQKAEKALKDAEKMKVDYTAEPNDIMEQEALKTKTVEAAKKQLEHAQNIKKTMTAKKVAETVGNTEEVEGAHEAGNVAAQKFANAPRLVGNKRTRMLPDGETKIRGHYEIVPAESLTPSHDVNNGYKKSEGFPTDVEGRTVNDRDYEHDKAAQHNTDQIAMKYNGMAIENVPVVSDEGIVYDGNGRTMAGQKAAKEGTDGEYINDLLENAENFGFTREQIEQSGIEHPRLVMVTDERLPYDAATFAKFNRNEKKTQSNTEQAVAKAKTLTSDEVGAIVAEIEGNGSLDAFFNNSKAINDLVKTLVDKGIIGQNEVAQMMDSPERLSAQGREYVKNLLLGSIFKPETIRMLGIDSAVKNKAINAIRSVMDNMKLGDYSLRDEIDQAIQLLYEARRGGNKVDTLLRTPDMFGEDAAKRYPSISQMMALALEGKVADFRDLLDEYNRIAASRNTGEGNMFEAAPTKEELINEYLNFKKWQDYGTGHSENEGGNDVSGIQEPQQEASGGNESAGEGAEPERPRVEEPEDLVNKELESRIKVTDEETETPSENGPITRQKILINGDKEIIKVDEPNDKGEYTGSYYEYDGKKFGDLNEVVEYIDGKAKDGTHSEAFDKAVKANSSDPVLVDAKRIASKIFSFGEEGEEGVQILAKYVKLPYARKVRNQAITYLRRKDLAYQRAENAIKEGVVLPGKEEAYRKLIDAIVREDYGDIKNTKPSADPIEGIEKAAEAFRKEQKQKGEFVMNLKLGKARQEYAEAKEHGDASEIKRTRDELKQLLDEHYKAQHMGLVQRRKEIAKEIGMTEAKKIDKPWSEMDGEERMAIAEKSPLTEDEIRSNTSEENQDLIANAIAYLNGKHGFVQQLAYLKIYDDVRNRHENVSGNSGTENRTQLDAADTTGGEELGLGRGRESRGSDGPVDRGTGNEAASGEPEGRESNQNDSTLPVGKSGDKQGERNSSDMGTVPSRNTDSKGSGSTGKDGNVSEQGGRGSSNRPAKPDAKRKPAAKQGTTWRGRTGDEIDKNLADKEAKMKAAFEEMLRLGRSEANISLIGLNARQVEHMTVLTKAVAEYGMAIIDKGIYEAKDWFNHIREKIHDNMKAIGFTDQDIDEYIREMWNSDMEMDGETHTIAEWCSIYGNQKLREKLGEELDIKYQKQMDAEPIEVKIGDRKNIEETLPFLLPQQQDDVLKAETQFFGKDHTDREHAYGKGYMFTNGTGTGKTYTGLGIAKRLAKQGKGRILFITPSQKKVNDWMKDGKNLGLDIRDLDSVAKEKGTTATTESGDGMVITTFANFGLNKKLLETEWDAVIYDECHRIMENKKGAETARSMQHYMMTNRDENHCFLRLQTINPHYQKMQNAADRFNELRQKEVQRIQKEYKQSHPSATAKDVVNATFSQLPKELNSFALADATAFPKLGKAYQDFTSAKQHYYNNVEPKLKEQAKNTWKNTKTIFLSATPFNTRENLDYAEGYIFKFPEDDGSRMSGRSRFYLDHFGAAYRYRYNRLEAKTDNPAAVAKQEVAFSDYLQDTLGTMSGRIIDSAYDYSRDFPTVAPDHADEFNNAVEEAVKGRYLGEAYSRTIGDYNYGSALFETMKVANIIQRMKDHLAAGRKIVVFHRRVETKNPIQPPFAYMLDYANRMIAEMKPGKERNEAIKECTEFRNKYADLLDWEQTLDYSMPREQIAKVFGKDNVLFFSGKESKKVKDKAVDTFNDDNSGKNIIVIQEASGKEGISLHDVTGNHQRVLITLGLPQSPITALQIEGRTYRIGNKSNAIFEYPILGLNSEMMLFGQKFNNQVSTTENLALGSQARNLRDSFANGILEHSGIVPIDQQGVGGKEFDAPKQSDSDPFDDAVLDYYSNQKLNRNNREGVDYFPTPEPLGYKMVEWANMGEGDTALEPSAGHGAIARYVSKSNELLSIEPSQSLFAKLQLKAGGLGRKFLNSTFENYNVANKHDVVVMNPPFGTAGATAIAHLDKAFRHLDEGGRVVAIIPRGSTDKKFDKWYGEQKNVAMRAEVDLPDIVFQQAGTNVRCRVVVLDKITDNALRSKAGYPEKIDLSGHYDKIEDFFEDLRDVQMPDRIIDTQMKSMKKARTFKKDIEDIKGMTVTIEKNGISVFDKNAYRDYSISFPSIKHNEEWTKENYSKVYERFDQEQNRVYSENSKAALDEMKKLACKLAGMSEEEMQRYIASKNNGGTHFRESRGLQYSKSDTKDVKNSRIIPEDVDKNVSSQIEKTFDSAIEEIVENAEDRDKSRLVDDADHAVVEFSNLGRSVIEYYRDDYERKVEKLSGQSIGGHLGGKNDGKGNRGSYLLQYYKTILAVADRELAYRDVRAKNLRETWGLQSGGTFTLGDVERIFKETNRDKAKAELFQKALDISKRLGVNIKVSAESPNKASGEADIYRNIDLYIDGLVKTKAPDDSAPTIMLHEMIHEATMGAINLVKKGKAEGALTPKQIEGVKTILEIYDRVKDDKERFKEEPYGLSDAYELTAQMADSRQRKAMDLSIWDRVVNAVHEFARKGDRSILQRVKDAMKKLFEVSDKSKMDKALNDIMDDFNETIDDISMDEIEQDGFAYKLDNEEDRKLFDSLNNKRNTRKEYNDTVTELARRMAEGDRSISERTTGGMEETEKSISSGREDWRGASMGRSYAGFNIRPKSIAHCAADIIANDVSRRGRTQRLSSTRTGLELGQKGSMEDSATDTTREISSWELTDQRVASVGEREVSSRIENWAKQNNAWFDWRTLRGRFDRNERLGTGDEAESDVFLSKDGKSVLKIVRNPHAIYDTLQGKLDSIALHNELFPTDAMNVIGFTKVNEDGFPITSILLEQPFIEGKTVWDSFGTKEERMKFRDNFMKSLGFTKEKWAATSGIFEGVSDDIWRKGDYAVEDVNAGNIIIDKNGKGHIIDCVVSKYNDAIKDKIVYDSTEEKKQIQAENKAVVERLREEVKNQELRLEALQEARNENNKDKIDEFIDDAKNKIAGFEKQIKEKQNAIHFREEENDSPVKISNEAPVVVKHIAEVAKKVGAKVQMVSSVDEITNKAAKAAIEEGRKITGWYDEKTGEVHLYMPNIHDRYTAEKTIWHETVGHKGMRGLMGESFDKFLDSVWYDLDKPGNADLKKLVTEEMKYSPLDYRNAIEEGIARMAEEGKGEPGFWNTIKNKVSDFFHELGYRMYPNTKDVKYLLWLSKNLQKNPNDPYWKLRAEAVKYRLDHEDIRSVVERNGMYFDNDGKNHDYLIDLNHKDFEEATDGKVHFRTTPTTASKIEEYNRRLATKLYAFKESTVDHMQSLQEAMEIISGEKNVWTDIPSAFNPLMAQNSMDSKVQQVSDSYDRKITEPLDEAFQKVVALVDGKNKDEQLRNAQLYMITKHGLERNRVFFVRDAIRAMKKDKNPNATSLQADWTKKHKDLSDELEQGKIRFEEYLNQMDEWIRSNVDISYVADEHDYSGFHGMQGKEKSDTYDDKLAIDNVMSVESKLGGNLVKDFWSKKKAATDYIIDQQYTSGFADEVERDYLKGRFQWYVPLRKFDGTTAEDIYGYITEKGDVTDYVGPVLANAEGRSSLSDVNVLAQITAIAKASIINGGKNVVKQHLARFISAYENGDTKNRIFVEINPWAEKHVIDGNEVWEEVTPQIPEDATQEQISNILQSFENSMKAKQASGDAKLLKNKADIGFKFQRAKNKSEHIVDVYIAGKKKSFVCQGNPRAAQAINGLLVDSGTRNAISEIDAKITRKLAQFNTSLNPDFMSSNMLRDLTSASANVTKEGFGYTKDFLKAYAGNMRSIMNLSGRGNYLTMFRRYREDKLDMNNERDRMFKEFMDNGGQTGFVQIKKFEDLTKEYDNLIKKGNKDADRWLVKKIKKGLSFIEAANEIVEGIARYSTYCTSRKHGRSIGKSIYDAKEVSGNFNRHGSGDAIKTLKTEYDSKYDKKFRSTIGFFNSWMKNHTQFYNAGVQGANLLFKNYKSAAITTAISFGFMPFGLGIAQALINQYLISREDEKDRNGVKDPYAELPEWKRRNNICIYWGHGKFKTIPLGIELRASFGIGDIAAGYVVNENLKSDTPIGYDILGQIAQLIPASDFLGHHSPSSSIKEVGEDVLLGVTPTTIKAFGELAANRDWTGRPFYRDKDYLDKAPRWKSAYDNTSDIYMTINKWANQSTNGIDASNPDMKGNETLDYLTAPYAWQHVIDSYTGGMGSTIRRAYDTGSAAIKGVVSGVKSEEGFGEGFSKEWSKLDKNQIPLYRVFNYTPPEGNDMQRTKSKWYNYTDEFEQIEYNLSQMRTDTPDLVKNFENHDKLYKFVHSDKGKAYIIWKAADDFIYKKRRDLKKVNDPVTKKSIEEQINIKMQEAVNDLDKLN